MLPVCLGKFVAVNPYLGFADKKKFSAVAQGIGGSGRDSDDLPTAFFTCKKISEGRITCSGPYRCLQQAKNN